MSNRKNNMQNYSFRVFWYEPDKGYIATSPEFPDQSAFGETAEEALSQLKAALELAVQIYEEEGWSLPEPIKETEYSGQFRLRMPKYLHAALASRAQVEHVSLNTLVVTYLSEAIGKDNILSQVQETLDAIKKWRMEIVQSTTEIKSAMTRVLAEGQESKVSTVSTVSTVHSRLHGTFEEPIKIKLSQIRANESESKASWLRARSRHWKHDREVSQ